jgi:hypothetical protein
MSRLSIVAVVALTAFSIARAADLEGVSLADTRVVDGKQMLLNGIGLRTFSIFRVRIYVAGLYLEHRSNDPVAILHSSEMKLLDIRFLRDVDAENARKAWQDGFENNCKAPCHLDPDDVQRFLSAVPSVHRGDEATFLFSATGANLTLNGRPAGSIVNPHFANAMLATFIGPEPPTPRLKRELLGGHD